MRASFNQRAMTSPLGNDLVPDYPTREVLGCPRLLRWDLMTPIQWISKPGESMDALVERSGLGNFWPIKDQEVKNMVKDFLEAPKRDQWVEFAKRISRLFVVPSKRGECTENFGLDDTHKSRSVH